METNPVEIDGFRDLGFYFRERRCRVNLFRDTNGAPSSSCHECGSGSDSVVLFRNTGGAFICPACLRAALAMVEKAQQQGKAGAK